MRKEDGIPRAVERAIAPDRAKFESELMLGPALRAVCMVAVARPDRPRSARVIAGGSDAPDDAASLVARHAALISERPTCLPCLSSKLGISKLDVVAAMSRIEQTIEIVVERRRPCTVCGGASTLVYWLKRA